MNNEVKQKQKRRLKDFLPTKRRLIQLYAALLFNANLKGFGNGRIYLGGVKNICAPGLNCYSCPGASAACPLGALQNALASSKTRAPYYVIGIIVLYGILLGRWICGFLCPFGLIQELLHKIPTPKLKKNRVTRILSYLKYVILVVFVIIFPLLYAFRKFPLPAFCKYICPAGTLEGAMGLLSNKVNESSLGMLGPLFTWKFVLLVGFVLGSVFIFRFFCRFFCPLGALYGFFNKIALCGIKLEKPKCVDCGLCVSKCKMDIREVGDHECIQCGECMSVCPTKAITWKGSKFFLPPNEIGEGKTEAEQAAVEARNQKIAKRNRIIKIAVGVLMAAVLVGTLIYYNFIDKAPVSDTPDTPPVTEETGDPDQSGNDPIPVLGNKVGDLCYAADITVIKGEDEVFNVENTRGKVTVLNFWYTTCAPCLAELPHFDALAKEYGDQVVMMAVCAAFDYEEAPAFVDENFADYSIQFGLDQDGETYYHQLGGNDMYPMTVVIDGDGVIVATKNGPMSEQDLRTAIETALANGANEN